MAVTLAEFELGLAGQPAGRGLVLGGQDEKSSQVGLGQGLATALVAAPQAPLRGDKDVYGVAKPLDALPLIRR